MSAADEDTELRDLVAQTLEANGMLGKIRAQLRACVFLALEEQESVKNKAPLVNTKLKQFVSSTEGRQVVSLVREFLQFFNLEYSLTVFEPEADIVGPFEDRSNLAKQLDIDDSLETSKSPLLFEIFKRHGKNPKMGQPHSVKESEYLYRILTSAQISEARQKFDQYDVDRNGTVEKDELRQLFVDSFPDIERNMLDRYVNDEFRSADKDFSSAIEFDEFLDMYRRLFLMSKTSVSDKLSDILPQKKSAFEIADKPSSIFEKPTPKKELFEHHKSSDEDDDSFFDNKSEKKKNNFVNGNKESITGADKQLTNSMSSLAGLPSLGLNNSKAANTNQSRAEETKKLHEPTSEILDLEDNDYDDDFQASNVSPLGQTPRSARSDKNVRSLENDEIDEEIEEEISGADDLLKSDESRNDDLTTDRTISPAQQSSLFDYVEDILQP